MTLRALEPEDLPLLYDIENRPALWGTAGEAHPVSRYALRQYIAASADIYECGQLRLAIVDDDGCTAGVTDLTQYAPAHARAEVSIALLERYRGRGLAAQALAKMETWAVDNLRLHTLYARILPENTASLRLFSQSGYTERARLPQWHYHQGAYHDVLLFVKTLD